MDNCKTLNRALCSSHLSSTLCSAALSCVRNVHTLSVSGGDLLHWLVAHVGREYGADRLRQWLVPVRVHGSATARFRDCCCCVLVGYATPCGSHLLILLLEISICITFVR